MYTDPHGASLLAAVTETHAEEGPVVVEKSQSEKRKRRRRTQAKRQRTQELTAELDRIVAAGAPLSDVDVQVLDAVVEQLRVLAESFNGAVPVWLRARDTRNCFTGKPPQPGRDRSGIPTAGRIRAPRGLEDAQWKVSGGLPGTQRRH
jgi:hypothetical protein